MRCAIAPNEAVCANQYIARFSIQQTNPDFDIYRNVKDVGRLGLDPAALTGERSTSKTTKEQKVQIAGWRLDKWKFLPMIEET